MIEHNLWFNNITSLASKKEAADKSGIPFLELYDQLDDGILPEKTVIALARAYDLSPVKALAETGYLTNEEIGIHTDLDTAFSLNNYPILNLNDHLQYSIRELDENIQQALSDIANEVNRGTIEQDDAAGQVNNWLNRLPTFGLIVTPNNKTQYLDIYQSFLD